MMSVEMTRVLAVAQELFSKVDANDPRWVYSVFLRHEEGTTLHYRYAFAIRYFDPEHGDWGACTCPGEWLMICTEHHGIHVYPLDDLQGWTQYVEVPIEKHPDFPEDRFICQDCEGTFIVPLKGKDGGRLYHYCPWCGNEEVRPITEADRKKNSDGSDVSEGAA
jgi:hypothetical protein